MVNDGNNGRVLGASGELDLPDRACLTRAPSGAGVGLLRLAGLLSQ